MIAISIAKPGGPEVLQPIDVPVPQPGPREVLIRVAAAGVNRPDLMQREGKYPPPPGASDIPGLEVSGTIASCGPGATRWREGDQVCALVSGGGYAEYCVAPDVQCLPIPSRRRYRVRRRRSRRRFSPCGRTSSIAAGFARGESFLVHGGASGIGTTAIQMARAFGARVFATAGNDEKCAACERLGAERAINYRTEDFAAALMSLTGGRGIDVILDMVGAPVFQPQHRSARARRAVGADCGAARREGRDQPRAPAAPASDHYWIDVARANGAKRRARLRVRVEQAVWPLVEAGTIRPMVYATFPLKAGCRSPSPDGVRQPHREDPAYGLAA